MHITRAMIAVLRTLVEQIRALSEQIDEQLAGHVDAHIFTSLPRSGTVRAARLLAEIGDCRARFPTPSRWPALPASRPRPASPARSAPSGSAWACDKQLRDAVCDFAGDSRRGNPWAEHLHQQAIGISGRRRG